MMIKTVRDLGKFIIENEGLDKIDILTQKSKLDNSKKVICLVFVKSEKQIKFSGVRVEDYKSASANRYLYRTFRHGQYDVTPTAKPSSPEKLERRWGQWFGTYAPRNEFWHSTLVKSLANEILVNDDKKVKSEIMSEILKKYNELSPEERRNALFTIVIEDQGQQKYLAGFELFQKIFIKGSEEKFSYKLRTEAKGNGVCSLCHEKKAVYGFGSPFSIFTVKPVGFAPDFNRENTWKQLPICEDCAVNLVAGKEFLDTYLSFSFYGFRYYVLPNFIFEEVPEEVIEEVKYFKGRDYRDGLLAEEDPITGEIGRKRDFLNLIFVFYKIKQKDFFDIFKYVEDVPPSWLKKLTDNFNEINFKSPFQEQSLQKIFGGSWVGSFTNGIWKENKLKGMNLAGMVWSFFPTYQPRKDRNLGLYTKDFLDVIGDILDQNSIKEDLLMSAFVREIRESHVNEKWDEKLNVFKSLYLRTFLNQVDLIKGGSMGTRTQISTTAEDRRVEQIEEFFNEFSDSFDENSKRVLFLEGVLTRFLLDIQARKRGGSTPFRSKLHGLKLDQVKVKALFPEIIEKLKQYDAPYYSWLEELISQYFVAADNDGWRLSKDEINYYFALGLNMGRQFKPRGEKDD